MERRTVRTRDGVGLSCLIGGTGRPLVMLCGWSQAATIFERQFDDFSTIATVFALDTRGHGESDKPAGGYRIQRLAKDLFDVLEALGLDDYDLLAHSLGVSVAWSYLDMFGAERSPRRLVLVDEPAALVARPDWSEDEIARAGAIIPSLEALSGLQQTVLACDVPETHADLLRGMFTPAIGEVDLLAIAAENLKFPREYAATLIGDNCVQDWRNVIPRISVPTLVFAGEASQHPMASQQWLAETIPDARLEVIPADEGGSHFMFYENPRRFNDAVIAFLSA